MYFTDHIRLTSITSEVSFLFCHQEVSDHSAGSDEDSDVTITKVISQVRFHLCSTIYEHFPVFSWKLFCCVSSIKCVITDMPWIILFKTQASFPLQKLFTEERNVDEDLSVTSSVQVVTGETPDVCLITLCSFRVASYTCIVRRWTWQKV